MKKILLMLLLGSFPFSSLFMQAGHDTESAETIIAKVAEAMGGYDKIRQIETLSYQSIYPDHGTTPSIVEIGRPNKSRNPRYNLVFDGTQACFLEGYKDNKEPQMIDENQLNDFVIEIALHFPAFFDYPTKLIDSVMINFKDTYHLQTSLPRNLTIDYYIDKETFLLIKASTQFKMMDRDVVWDRVYNEYKNINGIMFPHKFTYPGKDGDVLYAELVNVEINSLGKDTFVIPDNIK
ncbi:MAG: hypothetical protein A2V66_05380 [Ignavibacteria bacterium RBG_13_36_8]|nr:MAG: hypothetical protein A2V66_05380 [Ignavibacteria bacterium RBG_13_36_8]